MNGKPTRKQKKFHEWAREQGCITDCGRGPVAIHHIKGARMRLKGVDDYAGEWFILPVSYGWHQDGSNKAAIHTSRKEFVKFWELTEKDLWLILMARHKEQFGFYPMTDEEYQIIKDRG